MSYVQIDCELRTDFSFRNRDNPEHHHTYSMLEDLPIDMIDDFVICDPLHLLELGIMKRLMRTWIDGKLTRDLKLSNNDRVRLDNALPKCNITKPSEIHRSVRSIEWLKRWKATEFRTILLYVGITVFKNIVHNDAYDHFLYLFCAVTICSADVYRKYIPLAKELFEKFVEMYLNLYGLNSATANVHNLCHVTDNVLRFGNLNTISTYPFENASRHIKLKLKQCNKSLEQVAKRVRELALLEPVIDILEDAAKCPVFKFPFDDPERPDFLLYNYICIKQSVIISNRKQGDKWFLSKTDEIVEFKHACEINNSAILRGSPLTNKNDFFYRPFKSSYLNIYTSELIYENDKEYTLDQIKCKLFCSNFENQLVFVPLLHSFETFD